MDIDLPSISIPLLNVLDHDIKGFPYKDIDSVVWLVESHMEKDLPITCYEDMESILRQLKSYQALIQDLRNGAYY